MMLKEVLHGNASTIGCAELAWAWKSYRVCENVAIDIGTALQVTYEVVSIRRMAAVVRERLHQWMPSVPPTIAVELLELEQVLIFVKYIIPETKTNRNSIAVQIDQNYDKN